MQISRRAFIQTTVIGGAGLSAFGFDVAPAYAQAKTLKIERTTETRSTCPYCSVSCGVILYSIGDKSKNAKSSIVHVEGDPDHPVNRGTLCPKGAALLDFIKAKTRLTYPEYRAPGAKEWKRVSWDWAMERIAKLMKEDRDKNFIAKNRDGVTVNRWLTTGFFGGSSLSNEAGYLTYKFVRATGILGFEDQARI
jgi:formate dehydrogenase major subunit